MAVKKSKTVFGPVDSRQDFVALEKEVLKHWYESGIIDKYLHKNDNAQKIFSFLDGPITANNPMGVHHAWGRTYKDLWQRWYNMRGFRQRFQNGFDEQGLWVEVEVEKELGLKSKKDIENLVPHDTFASLEKFVNLCKERVKKYSAIQTEQSKRLGYFMDWENSYHTSSDENNYLIWHFIKKCHEKGLIYKGRDSVPWCPRCGTAISQHEMLTEDYKESTHDSVYIQYPIKGQHNEFLLVWTTTPWTLPANVTIAVDPKKEYVAATGKVKGNTYYFVKEAASRFNFDVVRTFKGSELVGLEYKSPFDHLPRVKKALGDFKHRVIATDDQIMPISQEEGTGLVHTAPGAGSEDFQLAKELHLPVIEVIDEQANYLAGMDEFSGKNAKDHPELITDFLIAKDGGKFLFDVVSYKHRYPACWRCKTELVWRVVDEWYIAMDPLREPLKKVAKRINWIPKFGLAREIDWLRNMHDWLISKKRYWGLSLPIWECQKCKNFEVVGSKEELKERAVEGWGDFDGHSPHRPWIDRIKIKCSKCGELILRIPDVGNPWLDAGIVPFSTISKDNKGKPLYLTEKQEWQKWFPADFITESFPGQFKNWFYSLLAMSTVLEDKEPFKTVLGFGTLLGEDGRPMHKSWGNAIEFNQGADKIGVDIMRWIYARSDPSQNLLFGYKLADEIRRRFYLILWNSYKFFVDYANLANWNYDKAKNKNKKLSTIDRWVLARLTEVILTVNSALEKYDAQEASRAIEEFVINDFSTWYIRRCRDRVGPGSNKDEENAFLSVCYEVLLTLTKILAPFMPYITENMYKNLTKGMSVHLVDYPIADQSLLDDKLVDEMKIIREVAGKIHAQRKSAMIPVRQPLAKVTVVYSIEAPQDAFVQLLKEEVNVKNVDWMKDDKTKEPKVELDISITPELEEEGRARILARKIQEERKRLGLAIDEEAIVVSPWIPQEKSLVDWVKSGTASAELVQGEKFEVKRKL